MDVRLSELTAVGIGRQPTTDLGRAVGDEALGLPYPQKRSQTCTCRPGIYVRDMNAPESAEPELIRARRGDPGRRRVRAQRADAGEVSARYIFAGLRPGQRIPTKWLESRVIVKADTLEDLAAKAGLPADALTATVEWFNDFARARA